MGGESINGYRVLGWTRLGRGRSSLRVGSPDTTGVPARNHCAQWGIVHSTHPKLKPRFIIALAVHVVIIHMLSACTSTALAFLAGLDLTVAGPDTTGVPLLRCYRSIRRWLSPTGHTPPVSLGDDSDCGGSSGDADRPPKAESEAQAAENLLLESKSEELKELCKARGLPASGEESELAARFLTSQSRATNRQLDYIGRLIKRDHHFQAPTEEDHRR